nr:immunoglobulin heavy chain junction region [Macaca mulatta]
CAGYSGTGTDWYFDIW